MIFCNFEEEKIQLKKIFLSKRPKKGLLQMIKNQLLATLETKKSPAQNFAFFEHFQSILQIFGKNFEIVCQSELKNSPKIGSNAKESNFS